MIGSASNSAPGPVRTRHDARVVAPDRNISLAVGSFVHCETGLLVVVGWAAAVAALRGAQLRPDPLPRADLCDGHGFHPHAHEQAFLTAVTHGQPATGPGMVVNVPVVS